MLYNLRQGAALLSEPFLAHLCSLGLCLLLIYTMSHDVESHFCFLFLTLLSLAANGIALYLEPKVVAGFCGDLEPKVR